MHLVDGGLVVASLGVIIGLRGIFFLSPHQEFTGWNFYLVNEGRCGEGRRGGSFPLILSALIAAYTAKDNG